MRARRFWCLPALAGLGVAVGAVAAICQTAEDAPGSPGSRAGSYLAARLASRQYDTADAAAFFRQALEQDPEDAALLEQALVSEVSEGNWARAAGFAKDLARVEDTHRMARLVLGLTAFKGGQYARADEYLTTGGGAGPVGELTSGLARAWIKFAAGDVPGSFNLLDVQKDADWAREYVRFHRALLADVAGRRAEARAGFELVFSRDARPLRTALAYAQHLARTGDAKLARSVLSEHVAATQAEPHPLVQALDGALRAGKPVGLLVPQAADGLAEVFYGLGEALSSEESINLGILYLRLALYVKPDHPLALVTLAQAYETIKKYAAANTLYERIGKNSPLQPNADIQVAFNLSSLGKVEEARLLLEDRAKRTPGNARLFDALGNIMRAHKRYKEAVQYFTRAIALTAKPEKRHWTYFYSRGTCYERIKQWREAEADLQKALRLSPDQPLVLNYLGYSWIDQNQNLEKGMSLIEKAVALKPDDGYIVDSLGWAHYRTGNYREAVIHLERAVELRPDDPVLNDHLGDALWRVGREREARFQWEQALGLSPEPEDAEKIKKKLLTGLAPLSKPERQRVRTLKGQEVARRRAESRLVPPPRGVQ